MIDFDVQKVRGQMVKAVSLVVAIRRLAKPMGLDTDELHNMEREFREAAAELQAWEKLTVEDRNRPLLGTGKSS